METGLHTKKNKYPKGPWTDEPDELVFEHLGYDCAIQRGPRGCLNGYVFMPDTHPWFNHGSFEIYDVEKIVVHGGITYDTPVVHNIKKQHGRVLGFDTGHATDICPSTLEEPEQLIVDLYSKLHESSDGKPTYKDMAYVKKECESLAQQLKDNEKELDGN